MTHLFIESKSKRLMRLEFFIFLLLFSVGLQAQITVSGTVSDSGGPLPGVNIVLKGTNNGTTTSFDGLYTINNVPSNGVLVFSYVGYTTKEIVVGGKNQINVSLEPATNTLDEVVVVGYGSMERSNVTGAITTVDVAEIAKTPVPNVVEALRGQVAGLRVSRGNGQPGSGVNFTIRGINSLGEGSDSLDEANKPMIIVDGVPLPGGNLNEINPDDIENVNVIKDAGAGAIYGSSAANGVVLITTKSGKIGKPTITVNASTAINEVATRMNVMNGDEYIKYLFDSGQGSNLNAILDPNELENYIAGRTINWQDELLRLGYTNNVSMTISGGTEKMTFYMNGDMYLEDGIVTQSDYNRYSLRLNADYAPTERFKIGARVQLTKSDSDETSNSIEDFGDFAAFIPIFNNTPLGDMYNEDGSYVKFVRDDQFQINPFFRYQESQQDRKVNRAYVNPYVEYKILDGLKYTLNTFVESRYQFFGRFLSSQYSDGDPNSARIQEQNSTNYLFDNILNYKKDFGKHGIDATFVYGFQKNEWQQNEIYAEKLATDLLGYNGIDVSSSVNQRFSWDTDESGRFYYVGRLGYDYDNRYVLTLTLRRDGSSKFIKDNKWGYFPSVSVAWNAQNEKFWNPNWIMNNLKLRLTYGELGNDRIGTYRYQSNPNVVVSTILEDQDGDPDTIDDVVEVDVVGYAKNTLANPHLKWETSKQVNAGIDFGLLNSRISGSVDYYRTKTTDLLLPQIIPVINGYESYIDNIGETKNWGIDVALRANIIQTDDFKWNTAISWAKDKNEIVRLSRVGENGKPIDDPANGWFIGKDIREIYNIKFAGIWQTEENE